MAVRYEGISEVELLKIRMNSERAFAGRGLSPAVAPISIHTTIRNSEDRAAKIFAAAINGAIAVSSDPVPSIPMIQAAFIENRSTVAGATVHASALRAGT